MRLTKEDMAATILMSLLSSTPVAFMTFDFMFPNISTLTLGKNMMSIFAISILVGFPSGYLMRRTDLAMMTVILYTAIGYLLAALIYSTPYALGQTPGLYYTIFVRFTVILLFLYVLGGFVGTVMGQMVRDSMRKEETRLTFPEERGE